MENLLAIEAETKFLLSSRDRSFEQTLRQELLSIFEEAELLFGPRDPSYQMSTPRISECARASTYILWPFGITRIYLTRDSRTTPWLASLELAHEAIHILSPGGFDFVPTILEEGLAEWFARRYVSRIYGMSFQRDSDPQYDAVMTAVSTLMSKNEFVIRDLRARQPVISKIDEKLLIEVGGIEPDQAKFLCTDYLSYFGISPPWRFMEQHAEWVEARLRSLFDTKRTK